MDGLLVDTESAYFAAMTRAGADLGHEAPFELFRTLVGLPDHASEALLARHYGEGFPLDAFNARIRHRFREILAGGVRLKAGVVEMLDELDARGLPRAIATSSSHAAVELHLGWSGLLPRFQAVVARGDYERGKPDPDPFLLAADRLGITPDHCLALEDSHNGVRAAASAGMMTVMVPDMLDPTAEMESLCVRIARDLHEVRAMIAAAPSR
jgi:HAD superfamily hydrolase (TIGR01509 family)